jgi:hypothetical protein
VGHTLAAVAANAHQGVLVNALEILESRPPARQNIANKSRTRCEQIPKNYQRRRWLQAGFTIVCDIAMGIEKPGCEISG